MASCGIDSQICEANQVNTKLEDAQSTSFPTAVCDPLCCENVAIAGPIWEQVPQKMREGGIGHIPRVPEARVEVSSLVAVFIATAVYSKAGPGMQWKHTIDGWKQVRFRIMQSQEEE